MHNKNNRKILGKLAASALVTVLVSALAGMCLTGCGNSSTSDTSDNKVKTELVVLAAASLTDACNQIKEKYESENKDVTLTFSYGSSGALQAQIEEGAPVDIFMSAATKQMTALDDEGLMDSASVTKLLENKIVLIVPADSDKNITSFEGVLNDDVAIIGLGDPAGVPVGQYSEELFTNLGIFDEVTKKANYGSDVRTVLSWVETSAVDCGVVYATDAYTTDKVKIVAEAAPDMCKRAVYPVGITKNSANPEAAARFVEYLKRDEIIKLFEGYGFKAYAE